MKVMFLNLPYKFAISRSSRWPEKTKSSTMYYPYWLCYAAGVCMKQGYEVNVVDAIAKKYNTEQTINCIKEYSPTYLVTEVTTPTCFEDFLVLERIKAEFPQIRILVGGTHATALPKWVLENCSAIDIVMCQEYDFTVSDIILNWDKCEDVGGIAFRKDGTIIQTKEREWCRDLDEIPFVSQIYEKFLNVNDYFYAFATMPMVQIFSARGCPYRCAFCNYPETMSGRVFRKRSVENFVDELEYIATKMPYIREIFIEDDTFTVDVQRVKDICAEIKKRNLKIVWSCNTRVDLDYEVMKLMKEAGCKLFVVGYESGNQQVLDNIKKGIKLDKALEFAKNTKKLKMKVFGCFMIGLIGDTRETIEETFQFAKRVNPDMVFFQQAVPFPGTAFYQWAKSEGYLITEDYSKWLNAEGYLDCLVDYPFASATEIEKIRDRLMSRYYFSVTYILRTLFNNFSIVELKRVIKAGSAYIVFRMKKSRGR